MRAVVVGGNRFLECGAILAYNGSPILSVEFDPFRVRLATPENLPSGRKVRVDAEGVCPPDRVRVVSTPRSFAIFWEEEALVVATLLDPATAHVKIDLRPLGMVIHDDVDGLHIGQNVFSGNHVSHAAAAISLGD